MPETEDTLRAKLQEDIRRILVSCQVLFPDPEKAVPPFRELVPAFRAIRSELGEAGMEDRPYRPADEEDSIQLLNRLASAVPAGDSFASVFDRALLDWLSLRFPAVAPGAFHDPASSDEAFCFAHARNLAELLTGFLAEYLSLFRTGPEKNRLSRILPSVSRLTTSRSLFLRLTGPALGLELRKRAAAREPFREGRVFRHQNGEFFPVVLDSIRKVDDFYGYREARKVFQDHFEAFASGRSNLPLLISSLPGLGKTQMTIAYTLHFENLILILPSPSDISVGLESLIRTLAAYPGRKFMLFFDDIDASATDWFFFRANIGGTFSLPRNISITIASNQQFPANISSRGRGFVYPIFDEIRCMEMVSDFLVSLGMKDPPEALAAVIASDYVEEFGQKMFEELSPRTLVRYLQIYRDSPAKRKKMLDRSRDEIIVEPDAQVFYEENLKRMRSIYGDSVLEEMRKEILHE